VLAAAAPVRRRADNSGPGPVTLARAPARGCQRRPFSPDADGRPKAGCRRLPLACQPSRYPRPGRAGNDPPWGTKHAPTDQKHPYLPAESALVNRQVQAVYATRISAIPVRSPGPARKRAGLPTTRRRQGEGGGFTDRCPI